MTQADLFERLHPVLRPQVPSAAPAARGVFSHEDCQGARKSKTPLPFGRGSKLKRKLNGNIVKRGEG